MKYTREHLRTLKEAYATGALEVRFGDHNVVYRSEKEMAQIIARVELELGLKKSQRFRFLQLTHDKGVFE